MKKPLILAGAAAAGYLATKGSSARGRRAAGIDWEALARRINKFFGVSSRWDRPTHGFQLGRPMAISGQDLEQAHDHRRALISIEPAPSDDRQLALLLRKLREAFPEMQFTEGSDYGAMNQEEHWVSGHMA